MCLFGSVSLRSSGKTKPEGANEETGNVLKDALRRQEEDTEEPSLSLCPGVEVSKLARTWSQVICAAAALGRDVAWERLSAGRIIEA